MSLQGAHSAQQAFSFLLSLDVVLLLFLLEHSLAVLFLYVGGDSHSLYHLQKLKKRQLHMLSTDSILAPLSNTDNQKLELKTVARQLLPCAFSKC